MRDGEVFALTAVANEGIGLEPVQILVIFKRTREAAFAMDDNRGFTVTILCIGRCHSEHQKVQVFSMILYDADGIFIVSCSSKN